MTRESEAQCQRLTEAFERIYKKPLPNEAILEPLKEGSQSDIIRVTLPKGHGKKFQDDLPDVFILRGTDAAHGLLEKNISKRLSDFRIAPHLYNDTQIPATWLWCWRIKEKAH